MNPKKVLMVTMSLDIGGAETHVVALSKALKSAGYDVSAASSGGIYVGELQKQGIPHYKIPLASKNPFLVLRALYLLYRLIRREGFFAVHAHARIPAALSGPVCRLLGVPLVTTVHGVYAVNALLRRLTNWGEKTLAVSEDIREYLIREYKTPEKNIRLTINGIDTDLFSPAPPDGALLAELGLNEGGKRLLYLGRLSEDSGEYAFYLLDIAPALAKAFPKLQILVAGDGPLFPRLKQKARHVNDQLGYPCVVLAGARSDVPRILALSDAVVALSRAALEALSCEKPVVLAGNYGYMGLFTEDKLPACIQNNFTARGFLKPDSAVFLADCARALSLEGEDRTNITAFGRSIVAEHYSIARMAGDAAALYSLAAKTRRGPKRYDFALFGYYGYNNSGDDALLLAIVENLRKHRGDVSLCVMTNRVKESRRELGVDAFHRFNLWGVFRALRSSHVLVFGGGNLIQDATSTKSLLYYISVLRIAQLLGVKTMLYSNGIGPVARPFNKKIAASVLNRVDVITLRESDSLTFLEASHITRPQIYLTADETLTMTLPPPKKIDRMLKENGIEPGSPFLCVSLRPWKNNPPGFVGEAAAALDEISAKRGLSVLLIPMQLPDDIAICQEVQSHMERKCLILQRSYSPPDLIGIISRSQAMLGMRLHALIYAAAAGIPVGGVVYDNKITAFLRSIRQNNYIGADNLTKEGVLTLSERIFDNYEEACRDMDLSREKLRALALSNSAHALALLDGKTGREET